MTWLTIRRFIGESRSSTALPRSRLPPAFDLGLRVRPVDLVQVDVVNAETTQAGFAFAADGIGLEAAMDLPTIVPKRRALGEEEGILLHPSDRLPDQVLGMAEPVNRRRVDPIHPEIDRALDSLSIILRSPREFPVAAADRRDLHVCVANRLVCIPTPTRDSSRLWARSAQAPGGGSITSQSMALPLVSLRTFS